MGAKRGVDTPENIATAVRGLLVDVGETEGSKMLGVARGTALRLAVGLPVTKPVLFIARSKLKELGR